MATPDRPMTSAAELEAAALAEFDRRWADAEREAERRINMTHRDDIPWWKAPKPRRWHRCSPQTTAFPDFRKVERCTCGAIRLDGIGPWIERNSRR